MSCVIPAVLGIIKLNRVNGKYYPFIFMMILDVFVELLNFFTGNMEFINLYLFLTFGLFLYFVNINKYLSKRWMEIFLASAIVLLAFNMLKNGVLSALSYYEVCFISTILLFVSIDVLSSQVFSVKISLVKSFWFWFGIGSILMYGYSLLLFGLYFFTLKNTPQGKAIGDIWNFVNMLCYVFYSVAILKIPVAKLSFTYKKGNLINHV